MFGMLNKLDFVEYSILIMIMIIVINILVIDKSYYIYAYASRMWFVT